MLEDANTGSTLQLGTYSLLASLALTVLRRIELHDAAPTSIDGPDDQDRSHLKQLREFLISATQGAELSGNDRVVGLTGDEPHTLDDKLEAYAVVERVVELLGDEQTYETFVPRAAKVLDRLARDGTLTRLKSDEQDFVRGEMLTFLQYLRRARDLVGAEYEPLGIQRTLV